VSTAVGTSGLIPSLRHVGQVASRNGIATQLTADRRPIPPQAPGHLGLGKPLLPPLVDPHPLIGGKVDIRLHNNAIVLIALHLELEPMSEGAARPHCYN